jgi:MerR family transcriptional regulator/heat shock protein HspR
MIGVAAQLCNIHPQTLRQYERLGLINPQRAGAKNRLYSDSDIRRIKQIQRLTQDMGVNLAGVELILRLLDEMEDMRREVDQQFADYIQAAEERIRLLLDNPNIPIRADQTLLPVPQIKTRKPTLS